MKFKDEEAVGQILECAKEEFMQKGFADASMRTIAEKAGFTTGMLYSRFADKNELFSALVKEGADKLYSYFSDVQEEFAEFPAAQQVTEMQTRFKSCFYSKTGKRQHKIETCFCEAQKSRFCPKNSKKPRKTHRFSGFLP